ncbi:unnamed protein product [Danaus chrysippus]|uniref:(African queen) hypothetical protein n=1 Tax=Danaus chrysippus TaxID=151541 RepID=A0A8J2QEZ6_9NEOP|nr:unnamed protein product [Danaus chrysippus]
MERLASYMMIVNNDGTNRSADFVISQETDDWSLTAHGSRLTRTGRRASVKMGQAFGTNSHSGEHAHYIRKEIGMAYVLVMIELSCLIPCTGDCEPVF